MSSGSSTSPPLAWTRANHSGALLSGGPPTPALAHLIIDEQSFAWIPEEDFVAHFASDVDPVKARVMHAVQQALSMSTFEDVMAVPAWKSHPTWYLVATEDQAIPPDAERMFAQRWARPPLRSPRAMSPWSPIPTTWSASSGPPPRLLKPGPRPTAPRASDRGRRHADDRRLRRGGNVLRPASARSRPRRRGDALGAGPRPRAVSQQHGRVCARPAGRVDRQRGR